MDDDRRQDVVLLREALIAWAEEHKLFGSRAYVETLKRVDRLLMGAPIPKRGRLWSFIAWQFAIMRLPVKPKAAMLEFNELVSDLEWQHLMCPPQ